MPQMHDDAVDQFVHRLRVRMFTTSVMVDGKALSATPRRYFETAMGGELDVQAIVSAPADGGPLLYVGQTALTVPGAQGLADYLHEVLAILP